MDYKSKLKNPDDLITAKAHLEKMGFKVEYLVDPNANKPGFNSGADYTMHHSTGLLVKTPKGEVEFTVNVNRQGNFQVDQLLNHPDNICTQHDLGVVKAGASIADLSNKFKPLLEALAA